MQALERDERRNLRIGLSLLCDLPRVRAFIDAVQKSPNRIALESVTANTNELSRALLRGELDLAIVDLPVTRRGLSVCSIYKEPLVAALPQRHPLAQRPIVRLFELKQQICLVSDGTDPAAAAIEAMLVRASVNSAVHASNVIDLLDSVSSNHLIGLLRTSATRLRRDGVIYKPLNGSIQLETGLAGRKDDQRQSIVSYRDALIAFAQRPSEPPDELKPFGRKGILSTPS